VCARLAQYRPLEKMTTGHRVGCTIRHMPVASWTDSLSSWVLFCLSILLIIAGVVLTFIR